MNKAAAVAVLTVAILVSDLALAAENEIPRLNCKPGDPKPPSRVDTKQRVADLRAQLASNNIQAYIVLTNDDHQSEYVAPADARRTFISGFSGSSGWAVITATKAVLWTDSRYYLQADQQLDCDWELMRDGTPGVPSTEQWLLANLKKDDVVSADSKTVPNAQWEVWQKKFDEGNLILSDKPTNNLVDVVWGADRPPHSTAPTFVLDDKYAGESWSKKVDRLATKIEDEGGDALVICALDEVTWLLNIRGADIPYTPVVRAYAILEILGDSSKQVTLYVDQVKIGDQVRAHLGAVQVKDYDKFWDDLTALAARVEKVVLPVRFSYNLGASQAVYTKFPAEKIITKESPISVMKDIKNPVEAQGMRQANLRDSAALVKFLAKLEAGILAGENWDEIKASEEAAAIRKTMDLNQGPSFDSVSASGINSALPHYEATAVTNSPINTTAVYTIDSGGQYLDGTTDVTRTVFFGTPKPIHVEVYTRLLSGCITMASAVFPLGTTQAALDILVRGPLFSAGMDYGHGSGHGVGHFGNVHEAFNTTLNINYFGSQEPGFYKAGDFGMRLENLVTAVPKNFSNNPYAVAKTFLGFEPITLVPYETKMIDVALLTARQVDWLNAYHERVKKEVTPLLGNDKLALEWLEARTQPFSAPCNAAHSNYLPTIVLPIMSIIILFFK